MFHDSGAWPPPPDGWRAPPPRPPSRRERHAAIAVALLLIAVTIGPFAGTSAVAGVIALVRWIIAAISR